jgi:hypothetical protein
MMDGFSIFIGQQIDWLGANCTGYFWERKCMLSNLKGVSALLTEANLNATLKVKPGKFSHTHTLWFGEQI